MTLKNCIWRVVINKLISYVLFNGVLNLVSINNGLKDIIVNKKCLFVWSDMIPSSHSSVAYSDRDSSNQIKKRIIKYNQSKLKP